MVVLRAVVGQSRHDRVARSAIGAVDVGILVAGIRGIKSSSRHSSQTGKSGEMRTVGAYRGAALADVEFLEPGWLGVWTSIAVICAAGGVCCRRSCTNASSAGSAPSR